MRLTVIGCSGSYAGPDSPASSYLLEHEHEGRTWRVVLDLGSGALGSLQRFADPLQIDAVLITHLHADHYFDLSGYYVMRKYHPTGSQPQIPVWGPRELNRQCAVAYGLDTDVGMKEEFDFRLLGGDPFEVGPFRFSSIPVRHPLEAYAIGAEAGGRRMVYSGDTGPCDSLVEFARGADLFLCEAAFRDRDDNPPDVHLTGSQAAEYGNRAGVGRLVLTHVPPWHDADDALVEATPVFGGRLDLAKVGAVYEV
jgi:ribonuclease BN (tRNA processing enzyme)